MCLSVRLPQLDLPPSFLPLLPPPLSSAHRHLEWHNLEATVNEDNTIDVRDVTNNAREHLGQPHSHALTHLSIASSTKKYLDCK